MARSSGSVDSTVYNSVKKVWLVEKYDRTGKPALKITCPSCSSVCIVALPWRTFMTTTDVRPCPYCWALAYVQEPNVAPRRATRSKRRRN